MTERVNAGSNNQSLMGKSQFHEGALWAWAPKTTLGIADAARRYLQSACVVHCVGVPKKPGPAIHKAEFRPVTICPRSDSMGWRVTSFRCELACSAASNRRIWCGFML